MLAYAVAGFGRFAELGQQFDAPRVRRFQHRAGAAEQVDCGVLIATLSYFPLVYIPAAATRNAGPARNSRRRRVAAGRISTAGAEEVRIGIAVSAALYVILSRGRLRSGRSTSGAGAAEPADGGTTR